MPNLATSAAVAMALKALSERGLGTKNWHSTFCGVVNELRLPVGRASWKARRSSFVVGKGAVAFISMIGVFFLLPFSFCRR